MERKELEAESIGTWDGDIAEYTDYHQYYPKEEADAVMDKYESQIKELRYNLAMAKAYGWKYAYKNCDTYGFWLRNKKKDYKTYRQQWLRIAEALEAKANKLKEEK